MAIGGLARTGRPSLSGAPPAAFVLFALLIASVGGSLAAPPTAHLSSPASATVTTPLTAQGRAAPSQNAPPFGPSSAISGSVEVANWSDATSLGVNPEDPENLVASGAFQAPGVGNLSSNALANGSLGAFTSFDGGATWQAQLLPGSAAWTDPTSPDCGDTHGIGWGVAFGPHGMVYILDTSPVGPWSGLCNLTAPLQAVYLTASADSGRTWGSPQVVVLGDGSAIANPIPWARVAVDRISGSVYVAYPDAVGQAVMVVTSTDQGQTWSPPDPVLRGDPSNVSLQLAVDDGGLELLWLDSKGTGLSFQQWLNFTLYGGDGPSNASVIATASTATLDQIGDIAISADNTASPYAGRTYVSWSRLQLTAPASAALELSFAPIGGVPWSSPVQVGAASGAYACCSALAVGGDGSLFVAGLELVFSGPSSTLYQPMIETSVDGAATFSAPLSLQSPTDPGSAWVPSPSLVGTGDGGAVVVWTQFWSSVPTPCPSCQYGFAPSRSVEAVSVVPETVRASVLVELAVFGLPTVPNGTLTVGPTPTTEIAILGMPYSLSAPASIGEGNQTEWFSAWYGTRVSATAYLNGTWESAGRFTACYVVSVGAPCREVGAPGVLELTVTPSESNASVDGTPLALVNGSIGVLLSPGPHNGSAEAPGYSPVAWSVEIGTAKVSYLNLTLSPLPGVIAGVVTPAVASVLVDGRTVEVLPNGSFEVSVSEGLHELDARAYGWYAYANASVDVRWDRPLHLQIELELDRGALRGVVHPAEAVVTLNASNVATGDGGPGHFLVWLPAGNYSLEASAFAFARLVAPAVRVTPGVVTDLTIELTPLNVTFTGQVTPGDAQLAVGHRPVPLLGGAFSIDLPWGVYDVEAWASGFSPVSETVNLTFGPNAPLELSLPIAPGWIVGEVRPANASLTANGVLLAVDASGQFNLSVAPGSYRVLARLPGYSDAAQDVQVAPGVAAVVNLSLDLPGGGPPFTWSTLSVGLALDAVVVGAVAVVFVVASRIPQRNR